MHKQRLAILIVAGTGMLATFMPWSKSIITGTVDGTQEAMGWITFLLFSIPLTYSLLGNRTDTLKKTPLFIALIAGILPTLLGLFSIIYVSIFLNSEIDSGSLDSQLYSVSFGFGLYLTVIAGIAIPIVAIINKDNPSPEKI